MLFCWQYVLYNNGVATSYQSYLQAYPFHVLYTHAGLDIVHTLVAFPVSRMCDVVLQDMAASILFDYIN